MIEVDVSGKAIPRLPRSAVQEFVNACVTAVQKARAATMKASEASVVFVSDADMTKLNARYRGKRKTTDVLTFEGEREAGMLGEIVISVEQAARQAREQKHSLVTEVRYLLLHGVLHAYGYDHETDSGEMNALEERLRRRVGLD